MANSIGRVEGLQERFRELYGGSRTPQVAAAPGRVNLIGEHTDYNDGWVLPMALGRYVWVAFERSSEPRLRIYSEAFDEQRQVALDDLSSARGQDWFAYVAGVAWALRKAGLEVTGVDMVVDGNVPRGSGLSSSAALEMAVARALCEASEIEWDAKRIALLGKRAENDFVGVNCGVMDQMASALAEPDCAMLLDCRSLETDMVVFPDRASVVVMDTGSRRTLAASTYNERRASCDRAVGILKTVYPEIRALRDVDREQLESARDVMDEITFRRAVHVVEENLRPPAMAAALRARDLETAGRLMNESHSSLRDLYGVSGKELNLITDLARRHPACFGARLTGAGFGGCAVALVATNSVNEFIGAIHTAYNERVPLPSSLFACLPVGGARLVEPSTADAPEVGST